MDRVSIPAPDGVALDAALVLPDGLPRGTAVVALHGCGGPYASRDGSWAVALAHAGHIVLLPDSFGSRGLGSQCSVKHRSVTPSKVRRMDAIAAAEWLAHRPGHATRRRGPARLVQRRGGNRAAYTAVQGGRTCSPACSGPGSSRSTRAAPRNRGRRTGNPRGR